MRQALVTQYPHGISYILHNVLETLRFFRITALPWQDKFFSIQYGWPNQTLLQEAIDAANYLSNKWSDLDPVEKTMAMSTIRNMIKSEVIFLRGHMYVADARSPNVQYNGVHINLEECMFYRNLYIYSYTSDVYSQMCPSIESLPAPTRQTPKPSVLDHPSPPHGSKAAFSLDEFLSVNKSLRYLDREQQVKKYEEYLVSLATGLVHHRDDPDDVW
jgi:hypothetical protein